MNSSKRSGGSPKIFSVSLTMIGWNLLRSNLFANWHHASRLLFRGTACELSLRVIEIGDRFPEHEVSHCSIYKFAWSLAR